MKVNREELLRVLESVTPGLAQREILEQSSCLAFYEGRVITFNDEVSCSRESPLKIEGAVKAKPLLDLLAKLPEDTIEIEQTGSELRVKGKRRKSGIRMEQEVMLPVEAIESPEEWQSLDADFSEAVNIVQSCASTEESQFELTCIHLTSEYVEACDRFQIARYPLSIPVEGSVLVRADSLKKMVGFGMTEICETESWMHFRNPAGLILSCRRYLDEYASLDRFITSEGTSPITLPGGLEEMVAKAEIFSQENASGNHVLVDLRGDRIIVQGEGAIGWYKEIKKVKFGGDPIRFLIAPKLLVEISKKSNECAIAEGRLFIDTGRFQFATCTEKEAE